MSKFKRCATIGSESYRLRPAIEGGHEDAVGQSMLNVGIESGIGVANCSLG